MMGSSYFIIILVENILVHLLQRDGLWDDLGRGRVIAYGQGYGGLEGIDGIVAGVVQVPTLDPLIVDDVTQITTLGETSKLSIHDANIQTVDDVERLSNVEVQLAEEGEVTFNGKADKDDVPVVMVVVFGIRSTTLGEYRGCVDEGDPFRLAKLEPILTSRYELAIHQVGVLLDTKVSAADHVLPSLAVVVAGWNPLQVTSVQSGDADLGDLGMISLVSFDVDGDEEDGSMNVQGCRGVVVPPMAPINPTSSTTSTPTFLSTTFLILHRT